ncbi:MAG: class I SAM-dependent methyltransferase [Muribaculaceae bacterium]|nr:class I SAM-dependent methyltransferase [Muribaculaceae bacterium]
MEISEKMQEFVCSHAADDVNTLRLRYVGRKAEALDFSLDLALVQIEARRKARKKLPSYIENERFIFPTLLSEEQASNEAVARYHASLMPQAATILDLTAGLGIDDFEFAKAGLFVTACEIDPLKCDAIQHNAEALGLSDRITVENCDSIDYLKSQVKKVDVIFADPARRNESGGRVHALSDCSPDILAAMPFIRTVSARMMVKASPLLDVSLIRNTVENLKKIHIVCFRGECKEVLMDISADNAYEGITVVDLDRDKVISSFSCDTDVTTDKVSVRYFSGSSPSERKYLYEPNPGMMKVADWGALCKAFPDLQKCNANTHIFLSDTFYSGFPGRMLEIASIPDKKELKALKGKKFNVVARNYPLSAPEIARKYGIISGGNDYLYGFRCNGIPSLVIARYLKQDQ